MAGPLEHFVLPNVSWRTFERLLDEMGEVRYRVSYLDGNVEFMKTGLGHNHCTRCIGRLIFMTAIELKVPICSGGSTTLKNRLRQVCLEPDDCFWIKHEAAMRGKKKWHALTNPPPDLAVEVDVPGSSLDRLEIYAALKVPEIWNFDGKKLRVLILGDYARYTARTKSLAFPTLPMDGFARFVKKLGSAEEVSLTREFTEWLRSDVVGEKAGGERRNGRR